METGSVKLRTRVKRKSVVEISFCGISRLNVLNILIIESFILKIISKPGMRLKINLSDINFIDCSAIESLNYVSTIANQNSSVIELCQVQQNLAELIELVKEHGDFHIKQIDYTYAEKTPGLV